MCTVYASYLTHRSGSSIFGKLLTLGPRTIYLYEPLRAIGRGMKTTPKRKTRLLTSIMKCNVVRSNFRP